MHMVLVMHFYITLSYMVLRNKSATCLHYIINLVVFSDEYMEEYGETTRWEMCRFIELCTNYIILLSGV